MCYKCQFILLLHQIRFSSPERIIHSSRSPPFKSDVWSLALSIITLMFPDCRFPENPADIIRLGSSKAVLRRLELSESDMPSPSWYTFFEQSLQPIISKRSSVKKLLQIFDIPTPVFQFDLIDSLIRHDKLSLSCLTDDSVIPALDMHEIYYLLTLASPGFKDLSGPHSPCEKKTNTSSSNNILPPIQTLPILMTLSPVTSSQNSSTVPSPEAYSRFSFIPSESCLIQTTTLRERLRELWSTAAEIFYPLVVFPTEDEKKRRSDNESNSLPLVIRENDFAYQTERTILFKALINGIPYSRHQLVQAAKIDINPYYRSRIWSGILNVTWSEMSSYEKIDKSSITSTDRQISVDIPRCHQYNELLASKAGHAKLTRVLKAWLAQNESQGYVYWQGLDSLAAPFVIVNFSNEARAFACFHNFINKYLRGFFARDNSDTIAEYLSIFSHLIAFHDPALFNHLDQLSFTPELYAIPWFLTMFTHVLPLHKTIHVWDTLLFGNESFPLCIGLAILQQLRTQILDLSFNDCILIFSDLPEISIDALVAEAIRLFRATPKTATMRDWVPIPQLKSMICPMIAISDIIDLVTNTKLTLVLIDMRSDEERQKFGNLTSAIVVQDPDQVLDRVQSTSPSYHLLVVVNNSFAADQLVRQNVARVCAMQHESLIPNELRQASETQA